MMTSQGTCHTYYTLTYTRLAVLHNATLRRVTLIFDTIAANLCAPTDGGNSISCGVGSTGSPMSISRSGGGNYRATYECCESTGYPCVSGHCPPPPPPCSTGQWRCNNGHCIRGSYRCDGGSPDWCDRHLQAALARTRHRNLHSDFPCMLARNSHFVSGRLSP